MRFPYAYTRAQSPLMNLCRPMTAPDFRSMSLLRMSDPGLLEPLSEHGKIKSTTRAEEAEAFAVTSWARKFAVTFKAITNDDLGALRDTPAAMGRAAAETQRDQLVKLLTQSSGAGPVMGDGVRLFHSTHGNLAGSGAAIGTTTLNAARLALRTMKDVDGKTPIGLTPKYLVVGPAQETAAEVILATLAAAAVADVNVFSGRLTLLVEPRLTGNGWYIAADPADGPCLAQGFLGSAQGPQVQQREGWDTLGVEFRVVMHWGCGAIGWRGLYRNAGQ